MHSIEFLLIMFYAAALSIIWTITEKHKAIKTALVTVIFAVMLGLAVESGSV